MRDRDALLRAIAANHRSWFRRRGGALQECGGIDLIVEGSDGTIAFPAKRTRAAVAAALDRARELKLRTVSCWSLTDDKALGTLLIARGFEWGWQPWWMALDLARLPTDEPRHRLIHDRWREGFHVFTVRDEDRVIGGVSVNPWRGIAGIYDMGVRRSIAGGGSGGR